MNTVTMGLGLPRTSAVNVVTNPVDVKPVEVNPGPAIFV